MSIYKQIIFLFLLLIVVMISCLIIHIDDFEDMEENSIEIRTFDKVVEVQKVDEPLVEEKAEEKVLVEETIVKDENIEEDITDTKINNENEEKDIESVETIAEPESKVEEITREITAQEEIDEILNNQKIYFKRLSTKITDESYASVKKIAELMLKKPNVIIEIGGHTDAKGKEDVNEWVSLQRALSVKKELISLGIPKKRVKAKGYGETRPLVPNDKNGYSIENRRVEFKVIEE